MLEIAALTLFVHSQRQFAGVGKIRAGLGGLQIKVIDTVDPPLRLLREHESGDPELADAVH